MTSRRIYEGLFENPEVKRWYNNIAQGSDITADVYLRRLGAFCLKLNTTPGDIVKKKPGEIYNILLDYVSSHEKAGFSGSYIESTLKTLRSWLAHNEIQLTRKIKIRNTRQTPTLVDERVPTQDELRRIFLAATPKDHICCLLMAHSGLRPQTLGNYHGNDGLRVKDFPEMKIENKTITFETVPTMFMVRSELSKARHQYFTFLSEEGCECLKMYLEDRLESGEEFGPDTDIISPKTGTKQFIRTINIGDGIRAAIRKAGFKWRPYVLRAYFDTQLLIAEGKGKITPAYRAFFMGHVGDIEARYTTHKRALPKEMVDEMRAAYIRCQEFLTAVKAGKPNNEEMMAVLNKRLMLIAGFNEEEIESQSVEDLSDDEFQELLRKKIFGVMVNNGKKQKVISLSEVESHIQNGWEYVNTLPDGKAIVKLPT